MQFIKYTIITSVLIGVSLAILEGRDTLASEAPFVGFCQSHIHPFGPEYIFGVTVLEPFLVLTTATMCQAPKTHSMNVWQMACAFGLTHNGVGFGPNYENIIDVHEQVFIHPKWSRKPEKIDFHNFCIMRLKRQIRFGRDVQKVSLPYNLEPFPKAPLVAFGWGRRNSNVYHEIGLLQSRTFPLIGRWKDTDLYQFGYKDRLAKTTWGDNGGPMYSRETGKVFALICNTLDNPKDKMNGSQWEQQKEYFLANQVSSVRDWIDSIRKDNNKSPKA